MVASLRMARIMDGILMEDGRRHRSRTATTINIPRSETSRMLTSVGAEWTESLTKEQRHSRVNQLLYSVFSVYTKVSIGKVELGDWVRCKMKSRPHQRRSKMNSK
jgi:hypothetical protein